jgi:cell division protein FtsB
MTSRHKLVVGLVLAGMAVFLLVGIVGDGGLIDYYRLRNQGQALVAVNDEVGLQNLELYRVIERLSGDLHYIETVARRELGMVAPEEFIFKFEASRVPQRVVPDPGGTGGADGGAP